MRMNQRKMIEDVSMRSDNDCIALSVDDSKKRKRRIGSSGQKEVRGVLQQIAKTVARRQRTTKCDKPVGESVQHMARDRMEPLHSFDLNVNDKEIGISTKRTQLKTTGNEVTTSQDGAVDTIKQIVQESRTIQEDKENILSENSIELNGELSTEKVVVLDFDSTKHSKRQRRETRGSTHPSSRGATDSSTSSNDDSSFEIQIKSKEKVSHPSNSTETTSKRQWHCSYCTFLNDDWNKRRCTICTQRRMPTVVPYNKVETLCPPEIESKMSDNFVKVTEDDKSKMTMSQTDSCDFTVGENGNDNKASNSPKEDRSFETATKQKDHHIETYTDLSITTQNNLTNENPSKAIATNVRKSVKKTTDVKRNIDFLNKETSPSQRTINCEIEKSKLNKQAILSKSCSNGFSPSKPVEIAVNNDPYVLVSINSDAEVKKTVPLPSRIRLSQASCRTDSSSNKALEVKGSVELLQAAVDNMNVRLDQLFEMVHKQIRISHREYNMIMQNQNDMFNRLLSALDISQCTDEIRSKQLEVSNSKKNLIPVKRNELTTLSKYHFETHDCTSAELTPNGERHQDSINLEKRSSVDKILDTGYSTTVGSLSRRSLRLDGEISSKISSKGKLSYAGESLNLVNVSDGQKTKHDLSQSLLTQHDASQCKITTPSKDKVILPTRISICTTVDSAKTATTAAATEDPSLSQANSPQTINEDATVLTPTILSPSMSFSQRSRHLIALQSDNHLIHNWNNQSIPKPHVFDSNQKQDVNTLEKNKVNIPSHQSSGLEKQQPHSPNVFSTTSNEKVRIPGEIEQKSSEVISQGQKAGCKKDILDSDSNCSSIRKAPVNKSATDKQRWVSNRPSRKFILELEDVTREKLSPTLDPSNTNSSRRSISPTLNNAVWHSKRAIRDSTRGSFDAFDVSGVTRRNSQNDPKEGDLEDELNDPSYAQTLDEPAYAYQETVRCKATREGLPCYDCISCRAFFRALQKTGHALTYSQQHHLAGQEPGTDSPAAQNGSNSSFQKFSRHRALHPPEDTPADFWELDFIDEIPGRNKGS